MITGGEPTISSDLFTIAERAAIHFKERLLTSANPDVLRYEIYPRTFDKIIFIMNTEESKDLRVENKAAVYASILGNAYTIDLPDKLKAHGFSGLIINTELNDSRNFIVPEMKDFTVRFESKVKSESDYTILPDLTVIKDFQNNFSNKA
jgi:hypothetical protein